MKKKKTIKNKITTFKILIGATLVIATACKKPDLPPMNHNVTQLNPQEQMLIGKWALRKNETYEIEGVDSTGQYICTLIGESICNSVCNIEFKNEDAGPKYNQELKGIGLINDCDSTATFIWKAKQQKKLEIYSGNTYDIVYLTRDSAAFSFVHVSGILQLKSIAYYKKQ